MALLSPKYHHCLLNIILYKMFNIRQKYTEKQLLDWFDMSIKYCLTEVKQHYGNNAYLSFKLSNDSLGLDVYYHVDNETMYYAELCMLNPGGIIIGRLNSLWYKLKCRIC